MMASCLAMRVRRLERVVSQQYRDAVEPHGVTIAQVTLLAAITLHPGLRAADLSRVLLLDKSTLSRNLKRLEALELVHTQPGEARNVHLFVTDAGHSLLEAVHEGWAHSQRLVADLLGDHAETFNALADAMSVAPPTAPQEKP